MDNKCAFCGKDAVYVCSRCSMEHYCSMRHQLEHFKQHRFVCFAPPPLHRIEKRKAASEPEAPPAKVIAPSTAKEVGLKAPPSHGNYGPFKEMDFKAPPLGNYGVFKELNLKNPPNISSSTPKEYDLKGTAHKERFLKGYDDDEDEDEEENE